MKTIAERLKHAREIRGWTQTQLAIAAEVSTGTIGNIESGVRQAKGSLPQIAEALSISHKWLANGTGDMKISSDWPFDLFTPADYLLLSEKERHEFENTLAGAIMRIKKTKQAA